MAALPKEGLTSGECAFYTTGCNFFQPDNGNGVPQENKTLGVHICMLRYEGSTFGGLLQFNLRLILRGLFSFFQLPQALDKVYLV